jgi:hypothetical protein
MKLQVEGDGQGGGLDNPLMSMDAYRLLVWIGGPAVCSRVGRCVYGGDLFIC